MERRPGPRSGVSWPVPGPSSRPRRRTTPRRPAPANRSLLLGRERRLQVGPNLADRRVLVDRPLRRIDERDRGLDIGLRRAGQSRINEEARRVLSQAIVLAPCSQVADSFARRNPRREVEDRVRVPDGLRHTGGIEEVELVVTGSPNVVPLGREERPKRSAQDA